MAENVIYGATRVVPLTAPTALTSGQRFKTGSLVAVALTAADNGALVSAALDGVFTMTKRATEAIAQGGPLYHGASTVLEGASSTAFQHCGYALEAASTTATEVKLILAQTAP
jgi:predicted RecA/RadA family phage recombinase